MFDFILSAARCPGLQELAILLVIALLIVNQVVIGRRLRLIEKLPSVKDFLRHAKKK